MEFSLNDLGVLFKFDMVGTIAMGLISLYIGRKLKERLSFLDRYWNTSSSFRRVIICSHPSINEKRSYWKHYI